MKDYCEICGANNVDEDIRECEHCGTSYCQICASFEDMDLCELCEEDDMDYEEF
jgi:hypothetical protein